MAGRRTRNELGEAAQVVISHLTRIPQLEDSSIAVTGGFCLGHYAPDYRGTNVSMSRALDIPIECKSARAWQNIDLLTTAEQAPKSVEERLLCIPDTPFEKSTRFFSYKNSSGNLVSINIIPYWQVSPKNPLFQTGRGSVRSRRSLMFDALVSLPPWSSSGQISWRREPSLYFPAGSAGFQDIFVWLKARGKGAPTRR